MDMLLLVGLSDVGCRRVRSSGRQPVAEPYGHGWVGEPQRIYLLCSMEQAGAFASSFLKCREAADALLAKALMIPLRSFLGLVLVVRLFGEAYRFKRCEGSSMSLTPEDRTSICPRLLGCQATEGLRISQGLIGQCRA